MKVRLQFEKNVRYISHLELMRTIQKILKRSNLPIRYSEGFNPHIVLSIAVPIPVGVCGKNEYADFELTTDMTEDEIISALKNASDSAVRPKAVKIGDAKDFKYTVYAKYSINIVSKDTKKIIEFLSRDEINTEKKAKGKIKIINLKEYIHEMNFQETADGLNIDCILACGNEKNLNPMLIRKALIKENFNIEIFNADRIDVFDAEFKGFF